MDILGKRKIWYTVSIIVLAIGLVFLFAKGLNYGIDFDGGTLLEYKFDQEVSNEDIRSILEDINVASDAKIQQSTGQGVFSTIIRTKELTPEEKVQVEEKLRTVFPSTEMLRSETVGPIIGEQLRNKALLAMLIASVAIVLYISVRFEFRFAIISIITLLHDVLITVGIFALIGKEINTPFVAALLTIIGYSINDTIVIFDRIRENMKLMHNKSFEVLANSAVVDTLPRSINTSLTTLITILAIYLFGGASIKTFMLALFIGMFAGTYSSIFVASPLLVTWTNRLSNKK